MRHILLSVQPTPLLKYEKQHVAVESTSVFLLTSPRKPVRTTKGICICLLSLNNNYYSLELSRVADLTASANHWIYEIFYIKGILEHLCTTQLPLRLDWYFGISIYVLVEL